MNQKTIKRIIGIISLVASYVAYFWVMPCVLNDFNLSEMLADSLVLHSVVAGSFGLLFGIARVLK